MNDQPPSAEFIQATRVLRVSSRLGDDVLLPERARIVEGVNALFEITVQVRSKQDIAPADLIGTLVDVELEVTAGDDSEDSLYRPFSGLVTALHAGPKASRELRSYTIVLQPQFWLLSQRTDHRIWMDKTAIEVLEILLSEHGLPGPDISGVIGQVPPLHYSVQHGESDFDYARRRLEEFGLFWWFSHEKGAHRLHVADQASGWLAPSAAAQGENRVRLALSGSSDRNHITGWAQHFSYVPGARAGADWNFETPKVQIKADTPSLVSLPGSAIREIYEYPARTATVGDAEQAEKLRMQATEADHERVHGESSVRILEAGRRFTPYEEGNPDAGYDEHVVIRAMHEIVDRSYETGPDQPEYRNAFEAIPSRVPLTPHRATKRPRIEGTQVAIVAGPEGEEIHPDKYGRVKLWFPWDRRASKDGSDTCWVRVGQVWGGGTWGAQVIPRIGMEVMVAYIDGDPDKPLIVGVVPNPDNMPAYDLPANKTRMVLRSSTHKGSGHNEISLEDEAGKENLFLHAQKDQTIKVLNNRAKRIDANEVESVGANSSVEVGGNRQEKIGGSANLSVGGGPGAPLLSMLGGIVAAGGRDMEIGSSAVGSDLLAQFASSVASVGAASEILSLQAINDFNTSGSFRTAAGGEQATAAGALGGLLSNLMPLAGIFTTIVEKFRSDTVGIARTEQIGAYKNTSVGHTMTINVGQEFIIKVGQSRFVMDQEGNVTITGTKFNFAASGHVQINGKVIDLN